MDKAGLDITNRKELEVWLKDKPIEWSQVIAARAALRVFPLVLIERPSFALLTFRATFISWTASKYRERNIKSSAANAADTEAAAFASFAVETVASINSVTMATFTVESSIKTALSTKATTKTKSHLWLAINFDADWLVENSNSGKLVDQPLWLKDDLARVGWSRDIPDWITVWLENLEIEGGKDLEKWDLILNWYKDLLIIDLFHLESSVSYFGEKADLVIATQPDEFWKRGEDEAGVEAVLADIAKIVDGTYEGDPSQAQEKVSQEKVSQETIQPAERTDVKPKSDEPTAEDELGRRPFAESLVDKINEVREAGQKDGFAVHLHAPWGAGKTSILLMMQDYMKRSAKTETRDNNWVVVNFNAWEHERRNPPWWPLMEAVERDCSAYLAEQAGIRNNKKPWQEVDDCLKSITQSHFRSSVKSWIGHKFRWCWWKLKTDWLPLVVFLILGGLIYFLLDKSELITNTPDQSFFMTFLKNLFPLILAAAGLYATFLSATRSMVFGSKDSANYYFQLSNDPLGRIHNLFNQLIDGVDRPVCIYIDDLDRCHADFVVDLLEGIQSSFRHEKVTYVVAADKGWIRSAFETRYETFKTHVGDDAQPIGYLFLEKIFQMSTPIPGMAAYVKQEYFDGLLDIKPDEETVIEPTGDYHERVENALRAMEEAHPEGITPEDMQTYVSKDPTPENFAAAVKLVDKSPVAERKSKHLLRDFAPVLTGNPREMKRLLNAFAMRRALWILQISTVSMEVLFRWTIIEQSYPALADELIDDPEWIEFFTDDDEKEDIPKKIAPFLDIQAIPQIITEYGNDPLTADHIRNITKGYGNYS